MVPIPDDPVTPSQTHDPVRSLIHAALALYLSPVIVAVCLVGGTSILAGRIARIMRRLVRTADRRNGRRRIGIVNTEVGGLNPPRASDRKPSQVAH